MLGWSDMADCDRTLRLRVQLLHHHCHGRKPRQGPGIVLALGGTRAGCDGALETAADIRAGKTAQLGTDIRIRVAPDIGAVNGDDGVVRRVVTQVWIMRGSAARALRLSAGGRYRDQTKQQCADGSKHDIRASAAPLVRPRVDLIRGSSRARPSKCRCSCCKPAMRIRRLRGSGAPTAP